MDPKFRSEPELSSLSFTLWPSSKQLCAAKGSSGKVDTSEATKNYERGWGYLQEQMGRCRSSMPSVTIKRIDHNIGKNLI